MLMNAGFECIESKEDSNYQECLAQLKNIYWQEEVRAKTAVGRVIKKVIIIKNNLSGIIASKLLPYSNILYLDNIIVVKKP